MQDSTFLSTTVIECTTRNEHITSWRIVPTDAATMKRITPPQRLLSSTTVIEFQHRNQHVRDMADCPTDATTTKRRIVNHDVSSRRWRRRKEEEDEISCFFFATCSDRRRDSGITMAASVWSGSCAPWPSALAVVVRDYRNEGWERSMAVLGFGFGAAPLCHRIRSVGDRRRSRRWEWGASWFDFSSESATETGTGMATGDFTVLSHLKELGCGELLRRPREIHFSGCINESYAFHCAGGDFFVKINRAFDMGSMFAGESEALKRMEATKTVAVPAPLGCGDLPDGGSYVIMKHLRFRPFGMMQGSSQSALGRDLARLHLAESGNLFGFPMQTRVGIVPLDNRWSSSWCEFFIEQRLRDRFQRVYERLGEDKTDLEVKGAMVLEKAIMLLKHHNPKPSILHGDLWMGNSGLVATGEVAIFDPACYIGDAEFDLAFEGWKPVPDFPGLSVDFYTAYHELLPQAPGFDKRHQLYQLFHLLNHFVIYGGEYYTHVIDMVDRILDQ